MATGRDRVWATALTLRDRGSEGFDTKEVHRVMKEAFGEEDTPSRKTIRNTLNSMADLGMLTSLGGKGRNYTVFREPRSGGIELE